MAAGDERIDVMDQVLIKNRLIDAPFEAMLGGRPYVWSAGQTRSIPRAYKEHFIKKGTYKWDPTEMNAPKRRLVEVHADGTPVDPRDAVTDLTAAEVASNLELLDDEHLPPRYFDEHGQPMANKQFRDVTAAVAPEMRPGANPRTPASRRPPIVTGDALDQAATAAAAARTV